MVSIHVHEDVGARGVPMPLPVYDMRPLGTLTDREGNRFAINVGMSNEIVTQLRGYSLDESDEAIQEHTSDRKRFGEGSYEEWYGKDRVPFVLIDEKTGVLAALVWFGPKPLGRKSLKYLTPDELAKESEQHEELWHTLVYRAYRPYRGRGLMTAFVGACIDIYLKTFPQAKLWVGIHAGNEASSALARKLGFKEREDLVDTNAGWLGMIRE